MKVVSKSKRSKRRFCAYFRKESGLESFVPNSLAESMKRKELKKLLGHFLKMNANLTAPGQKNLTALQAKLHYLKIISELPSYGAKCFSTTLSVSFTSNAIEQSILGMYGMSCSFDISYLGSETHNVWTFYGQIDRNLLESTKMAKSRQK